MVRQRQWKLVLKSWSRWNVVLLLFSLGLNMNRLSIFSFCFLLESFLSCASFFAPPWSNPLPLQVNCLIYSYWSECCQYNLVDTAMILIARWTVHWGGQGTVCCFERVAKAVVGLLQLEELPIAQEKVASLQQKVENLQAIINIKTDHEK